MHRCIVYTVKREKEEKVYTVKKKKREKRKKILCGKIFVTF